MSPRKDIVNLESFGVEGPFVWTCRLLFMLCLQLCFLPALCFTSCTLTLVDPRFRRDCCSEGKQKRSSTCAPALWAFGKQSLLGDPSQGDIPERLPNGSRIHEVNLCYGRGWHGYSNFIRFGVEAFTWSVDANESLLSPLQVMLEVGNCWFLRSDDHWGFWRF